MVQAVLPGVSRPKKSRPRSGQTLKEQLSSAERQILIDTLNEQEGNVAQSARALGLERSHLYKKMRHYGISPGTGKGEA
jgi:DNA-binding NtrC family response regulator